MPSMSSDIGGFGEFGEYRPWPIDVNSLQIADCQICNVLHTYPCPIVTSVSVSSRWRRVFVNIGTLLFGCS